MSKSQKTVSTVPELKTDRAHTPKINIDERTLEVDELLVPGKFRALCSKRETTVQRLACSLSELLCNVS